MRKGKSDEEIASVASWIRKITKQFGALKPDVFEVISYFLNSEDPTLESLEGASLLLRDFIGSDFGYARPSSIDASYEIEGINVRISPTSIVFVRNPSGGMEVGILKLHCSKSFRLSAIAAADYGALLHWYSDAKLGLMGPPNPDLCIILDVFSGEKFKAPKSFKMRRRTISEACQEIADRWDKIASREDTRTSEISVIQEAGL